MLERDVRVEEGEELGEEDVEGQGGAVPMDWGEVEDDGEVGGIHGKTEDAPDLSLSAMDAEAAGDAKASVIAAITPSPIMGRSESPSRAPVTKALPALAVTMQVATAAARVKSVRWRCASPRQHHSPTTTNHVLLSPLPRSRSPHQLRLRRRYAG